jgi:hypothetical protein
VLLRRLQVIWREPIVEPRLDEECQNKMEGAQSTD